MGKECEVKKIRIKGMMPAILKAMNMLTESDLELGNRTTFNLLSGAGTLIIEGNPEEVLDLLMGMDLQIEEVE